MRLSVEYRGWNKRVVNEEENERELKGYTHRAATPFYPWRIS